MAYLPIEDYGIIGNLQTIALVGMNGSIDWFCFPHFDSPSVFAAILDERKGGYFRISPATPDGIVYKQIYWPETNVLVTRFLSEDGVAEIIDYMPVGAPREDQGFHGLVRQVKVVRGRMTFRVECFPAFDYGRDPHIVEVVSGGARFLSTKLNLALAADYPIQKAPDGVWGEFTLEQQQSASFELHQLDPIASDQIGVTEQDAYRLFTETVEYWQRWIAKCTYKGRWRETVHRSALVLKLLMFEPTGAIVAAPTTSLPEAIGGERNWDYRYTWIRDAAFTCTRCSASASPKRRRPS